MSTSIESTSIDDGAVMELIVGRLEAAASGYQVLEFGEPLPLGLEMVVAIAQLEVIPLESSRKGENAEAASGTLSVECVCDPGQLADSIYKLPMLAAKVAAALSCQTLRNPVSGGGVGSLGSGHEIVFGRVRRLYTGMPPDEPRNFKVCRLTVPLHIKRESGNTVTDR